MVPMYKCYCNKQLIRNNKKKNQEGDIFKKIKGYNMKNKYHSLGNCHF